jgi:hypothetical protein
MEAGQERRENDSNAKLSAHDPTLPGGKRDLEPTTQT